MKSTKFDYINEVRCRLVSGDAVGSRTVGSLEVHRENLAPNSHILDIELKD